MRESCFFLDQVRRGGKRKLVIGSHVGSKVVNVQKLLCAGNRHLIRLKTLSVEPTSHCVLLDVIICNRYVKKNSQDIFFGNQKRRSHTKKTQYL